jgi:mannose/fructose/N-acetylgalactosamine-specific phosphotransferase system component IIC
LYVIFLKLALIGGIIGLDTTAVGQIMISQPLVTGAIMGLILGDLPSGILIGTLLQLIWVMALPIGGAVPPDTCLTTILATTGGIMAGKSSPESVMLAIVISFPAGFLSSRADVILRQFNIRLMHWVELKLEEGKPQALYRGVMLGVLLFFLKNFLLLIIFLPLVFIIVRNLLLFLPEWGKRGLEISLRLLPALGIAVIIESFTNRSRIPFFLAGGLISILVIEWLKLPLSGWIFITLILWGITFLREKKLSGKSIS